MDSQWVAIAFSDVVWISLAFTLGICARLVNLPPLVGFLVAGFVLNFLGAPAGDLLEKVADLGVTLLLFTIGLKLNIKTLLRPQVWAVTGLHTSVIVLLFGSGIYLLGLGGLSMLAELSLQQSLLLAFAFSFSSTVFIVKILEEKGEMNSLHGRVAIGILVMQDILAVVFIAASTGKLPTPWALLLFLLIPMRPLFFLLLKHVAHGELLVLFGLVMALGGAEVFELSGIKDDLGALVMGLLISPHPKSSELSKAMLGFKDLFLVGFFLLIGMRGEVTLEVVLISVLLIPFILVKSIAFYALFTRFKLRARTSLLTTLNLSNYSEFGLIVASIGVANGWLDPQWLVVVAIAMSLSFVVASPLGYRADQVYSKYRHFWLRHQRPERLDDDQLLDTGNATIAIFGMGRVGTGAYNKMCELYGETVVGIDIDGDNVARQRAAGRNVMRGSPRDADFWEIVHEDHRFELIMLALPNLTSNLAALEQLRNIGFEGHIATTAKYPDEVEPLRQAGATDIFNIYAEAGVGFASHVQASTSGEHLA
jgi:predicted Kef-type K+ transport protein